MKDLNLNKASLCEDIKSEAQQYVDEMNVILNEVQDYLEGTDMNLDKAIDELSRIDSVSASKFANFFKEQLNFSAEDAMLFSKTISPALVKYFFDSKDLVNINVPANIKNIAPNSFKNEQVDTIKINGPIIFTNPVFNPNKLPKIEFSSINDVSFSDIKSEEAQKLFAEILKDVKKDTKMQPDSEQITENPADEVGPEVAPKEEEKD